MGTSVSLQDIINLTGDYTRNYTTGNVDLGQRTRAINQSIDYFKLRLGIPSDEFVQSFYYVTGTYYYNLNADFNEPIGLFYHNYQFNTPDKRFEYRKYPEILQIAGLNPQARYFSFAPYNAQTKQLVIVGPNLNGGNQLDSFDNAVGTNGEGWVGQGDANTLVEDSNIKTEGNASLSFNITPSSGTATLNLPTYQSSSGSDFTNWLNNNAWILLDVYMSSANFSSLNIHLQSSSGNYYLISTGVQSSGAAFVAGQWNTVAFQFNNATPVGSPVMTNINSLQINFVEGAGFTQTNNMRVDNMKIIVPDYLDLIYYTQYKGLTAGVAGAYTYNLANTNDTALFGSFTPQLIDPIAKYAATILIPQLRQDPNLRAQYLNELGIDPKTGNEQNFIRMFGKIYPRKRIITLGRTMIRRGQAASSISPFTTV